MNSTWSVTGLSYLVTAWLNFCYDLNVLIALSCCGSRVASCCAAVTLFPPTAQRPRWAFLPPYIPIMHRRGRNGGASWRWPQGRHGCTHSVPCHSSRITTGVVIAVAVVVVILSLVAVAEIKSGSPYRLVSPWLWSFPTELLCCFFQQMKVRKTRTQSVVRTRSCRDNERLVCPLSGVFAVKLSHFSCSAAWPWIKQCHQGLCSLLVPCIFFFIVLIFDF